MSPCTVGRGAKDEAGSPRTSYLASNTSFFFFFFFTAAAKEAEAAWWMRGLELASCECGS